MSGQEISQFFNHFGAWGVLGLLLAVGLLSLLCGVVFSLSKRTGIDALHRIVVPAENRVLRTFAGVVAVSFMFGTYVVMCAGAGTLLEQLSGSSALRLIGSALFCVGITLVAVRGMGGAVKVFGKIIPLLIVLSILVMVAALAVFGRHGIRFQASEVRNPVVNHWALAAVTFVSYNFLCSIGTLASLGTMTRSSRDICVGAVLGGVLLLVVSMGINTAMAALPACTAAELPMLYLAGELNPILELAYAVVIFLGMFGASMSVFVPVPQYLLRLERLKRHKVFVPAALSVLAFFLSQVGFSSLIGTMFPVYGFIGFLFIAGILIHTGKVFCRTSQDPAACAAEEKESGGEHGSDQ